MSLHLTFVLAYIIYVVGRYVHEGVSYYMVTIKTTPNRAIFFLL